MSLVVGAARYALDRCPALRVLPAPRAITNTVEPVLPNPSVVLTCVPHGLICGKADLAFLEFIEKTQSDRCVYH